MQLDPNDIFPAYEIFLKNPNMDFEQCKENPALFCHAANSKGKLLVVYGFKEKDAGIAVVVFLSGEGIDNTPSFNMLYSVSPKHREKGLGTKIVKEALEQFICDFSQATTEPKIDKLYITSYVSINNLISQKVSRRFLSTTPTIIKDTLTGEPQFFYKKLISLNPQ